LIAGVTSANPVEDLDRIKVTTAAEMHRAAIKHSSRATIFIAAAAVADYAPTQVSNQKIKKSAKSQELQLERTPDILKEVAQARRDGQIIVGFAAETENLIANAREKLASKNLDMIVANDVTAAGSGFDSETNAVAILLRDQADPINLPLMSKLEIAHCILDQVVKLRNQQAMQAKSAKKS
jgi:phosphopantothenoylcysteine decarboxylase/phosphopantothenate--cysteine ligase